MKATAELNEIRVYHQSRYVLKEGNFLKIGPDEEVISEVVGARMSYDDPWLLDGTIQTTRTEVFSMCDLDDYPNLLYGICRQVSELIALGWGKSPAEVVGWFQEPETGRFVVKGPYMVVGPVRENLDGLLGLRMDMAESEEDEDGQPVLRARVHITDRQTQGFSLAGVRELGAFLIGTMPVS